jgi:hypothetical protein
MNGGKKRKSNNKGKLKTKNVTRLIKDMKIETINKKKELFFFIMFHCLCTK